MRILLVEDDPKVGAFIERGLAENGYVVELCPDGTSGLATFEDSAFDLVILDWMLPDTDGVTVCRRIREISTGVPVLFLTVKGTIADKVTGLEAGADDYLTKPFSFLELLARTRALVRRRRRHAPVDPLSIDDLTMDLEGRRVSRGGEAIDLTSREFSILEYFLRNQNRLITRATMADQIWNIDFDRRSNVVDVYISYLRKKLDVGSSRPLIHTLRGAGYVLKVEEQ